MEEDLAGVRIHPNVVEINDAEVNVVHKVNISVKNVSKTSRAIRYYGPQSKVSCRNITSFQVSYLNLWFYNFIPKEHFVCCKMASAKRWHWQGQFESFLQFNYYIIV